jgi:FkbM family methyltransferase
MIIKQSQINGIKFFYREGTSDLKTFEEVIGRDVYQKRGMKIEVGETWYDCGGNVGAFTLLACSKGANVKVFEPDHYNCEMIQKNLKLNGFIAEVVCAALVHNDVEEALLFVGNNGNVWRNSLHKNWNGKGLKVKCVNFDEYFQDDICVKMDIEGAEMLILENTNRIFKKMVFEWSFDIDPSLNRLWNLIDKQKNIYDIKFEEHRVCYDDKRETQWQKSWFPACSNVFCYKK